MLLILFLIDILNIISYLLLFKVNYNNINKDNSSSLK